ncbi:Hri1p KNAG_0F03230 [Huiozyma naganishii CBS 8797]|uniref:Protein HRI1 n=1 Tax=Huiozyma naganishii (strain ATCC MYA-139 / BCRC 22969 / CBS 8797 / KCTC 17520 / NBRC 10181 / NCYC 3082 / Yp74L-3) TaxID=1071383 RepID=J7R814_HUIN7|nr:hypothetical protein KNAG_0F03230 [Kazachstania naganishii CBS 8797]CCK70985.1 hypothetical protein KNAG_0F03230 [Kazachstania naganishii CBS 8797]
MPAICKRVLFEAGGNVNERTLTLSSVSNDGHYISVRPLVKKNTEAEREFPFEWVFAGTKDHIEVTNETDGVTQKQVFDFWLDTNVYLGISNTHRGKVHTKWTTWESGLLLEQGTVFPFGKDGEGVDFKELWQPIDANRDELVIQDKLESQGRSVTFKVDNNEYFGLVVVVGKWVQGFLAKKNGGSKRDLNFVRLVESAFAGKYTTLERYGVDADKFPCEFDTVKKGDHVTANGVQWEVIEAHL